MRLPRTVTTISAFTIFILSHDSKSIEIWFFCGCLRSFSSSSFLNQLVSSRSFLSERESGPLAVATNRHNFTVKLGLICIDQLNSPLLGAVQSYNIVASTSYLNSLHLFIFHRRSFLKKPWQKGVLFSIHFTYVTWVLRVIKLVNIQFSIILLS